MTQSGKKRVDRILGANNSDKIRKIYFKMKHRDYLKLIQTNCIYRDLHKGSRCFILGNGPSLGKVDFSLLSSEYVFTVNQLPRNDQFQKLNTNYHLWSDLCFFDLSENCSEDMELLELMKSIGTVNEETIVFYKVDAYEMIKKYKLDGRLRISYFADTVVSNLKHELQNLVDFTKTVPGFSTVIHYAICLAVYMGFSEIYLLGCDCTGFLNIAASRIEEKENRHIKASYGYIISENEKKRLEKVASYRSVRDELMGYVRIFDGYLFLKNYCEKHGVKLYNATEGSLLDCLPCVNLKDVLNECKEKM